MSVININLYTATDIYPYTDDIDFNNVMNETLHERVDASLIYTQDIHDTWNEYGCPEPEEFDMSGTISEAITLATYEALINEDYSDQWLDGQVEYAGKLLSQLDVIGSVEWSAVTDETMDDARAALEAIAAGDSDLEESHELLLQWRDTINAAA